MRKLSARIFIRLTPEQLEQIEKMARLCRVPPSAYARGIIEEWLGQDGGKSSELARISKCLRRPVLRAPDS